MSSVVYEWEGIFASSYSVVDAAIGDKYHHPFHRSQDTLDLFHEVSDLPGFAFDHIVVPEFLDKIRVNILEVELLFGIWSI